MKPFLPLAAVSTALALTATTGCMSTADANKHRIAGGAIPIFHHIDTDNDGKVTYAEFDAGFAYSVFATYNRDAGGSVTLAEWDAIERANQDKANTSFRALDLNHDGKLTNDELTGHSRRRDAVVKKIFTRVDKNHDGVLVESEAASYGIQHASDQDPANHP